MSLTQVKGIAITTETTSLVGFRDRRLRISLYGRTFPWQAREPVGVVNHPDRVTLWRCQLLQTNQSKALYATSQRLTA